MPSRVLRLWNPDAGGPGVGAWEEVGDSRLTIHLAAGDPHPQYLTAAEGGAYLPLTGGTLTGALVLHGATTATNVLQAKLAADAQPRFRADASGLLEWGGGGAAPDVSLRRINSTTVDLTGGLRPAATNAYALGEISTPRVWTTVAATRLELYDASAYLRIGQLGASSAGAGAIRLRRGHEVHWRNQADSADLALSVDTSDRFTFSSDVVVSEATPTLALKQAADTQARAQLTDTALAFGPGGATAPDATLQRTGAGALRVDTHLGVGVNPAAFGSGFRGLQVGGQASLSAPVTGSGSYLGENTYGTGSGNTSLSNAPASSLNQANGALTFLTAPAVAPGTNQTFTTRLALNQQGSLSVTPDAGQAAVVANTGSGGSLTIGGGAFAAINSRATTAGSFEFYAQGATVVPALDNNHALGQPGARWSVLYAATGTINTSSREAKQDIAPLDPAACAQAVLDTDWVSFEYAPPPLPPGPPGETVAQSTARVKAHSRTTQENAFARKQRGFVLGSPQHRVSDLFGLSDRKSTSPSSDLAVVAAALQNVLQRLQVLEAAATTEGA